MTNASGRVVIVNGTSGAGKSTTCETFQRRATDFWLLYGIDHFMAGTFPSAFGHHGPRAAEGVQAVPVDPTNPNGPLRWQLGPEGVKAFGVLHEWIAGAARSGSNIIFDHLMMADTPVLADCAWRLDGIDALLVTLKPPLDVLEQRVAERSMTKRLPPELGEDAARIIVDRLARLRGWFTEAVYAEDVADLTIDSAANSPDEICAQIEARLTQGPGTAMAELRRRYPRP